MGVTERGAGVLSIVLLFSAWMGWMDGGIVFFLSPFFTRTAAPPLKSTATPLSLASIGPRPHAEHTRQVRRVGGGPRPAGGRGRGRREAAGWCGGWGVGVCGRSSFWGGLVVFGVVGRLARPPATAGVAPVLDGAAERGEEKEVAGRAAAHTHGSQPSAALPAAHRAAAATARAASSWLPRTSRPARALDASDACMKNERAWRACEHVPRALCPSLSPLSTSPLHFNSPPGR